MCWRREYRVVKGEMQARNVDIHGFSHRVYSQREPRGGEKVWYPYKGYHKYHSRELVFPPYRTDEKVVIGDNLEALIPLEGQTLSLEKRETMTLREWLGCMEVHEYSNDFFGEEGIYKVTLAKNRHGYECSCVVDKEVMTTK